MTRTAEAAVTHALHPQQHPPRQRWHREQALCGAWIKYCDSAGWHATCPRCQEILREYETLEP